MSMVNAATAEGGFGPPISTVAGSGVAGFAGDGEPAVSAALNRPLGVAMDSTGTLYVADSGNHRVRKITADGKISTVAGTGVAGFGGDQGPAFSAKLSSPHGVAVDSAGTLYIADSGNHRIRKITTDGKISTVAGGATAGFDGDDGPASSALLNNPHGVAVDSTGVLYIADRGNHRIRKITTDGKISTVAGGSTAGFDGDDGPASSALLNSPHGVAVDSTGVLYIADRGNHRVRKITDGKISTIAGTGTAGSGGDDGPASTAQLDSPHGVAVDSTGVLYIADHGNHRIRRITTDGKISTVAGTGVAGFGGDQGPAVSAQLDRPMGLAVDCVDTLYIADSDNHRIRKITSPKTAGLPDSGTVVSWANVRSRLRMGIARESTADGAEVHQLLAVPRGHQRWRLVAAGQDDGDVFYRIENVRSGKVVEVAAQEAAGAVAVQRAYEGAGAHHQQWKLIPVGSGSDTPQVYEIANRQSGLRLSVDTNARAAIKQQEAEGDGRSSQWQLLPA
ncbi:RICIN domain-containing protein [Streptomyces sp. RerS4]|uniref:NHL domain-containing protein n=1 Tax=Streptomyces sp. RerS4 TaxID=2942449 RepID=UPI00201C741D|nr:RICIN domain-containing protein [Streptomyces sp. RerS4]UQW99218.1 RICIN domain-containing protein [Streptomyces sp. RerS4]